MACWPEGKHISQAECRKNFMRLPARRSKASLDRKIGHLLLRPARGWLLRSIGININNFSGPSVVELLASFFFNCSRIRFQRFNLRDSLVVFLLQPVNLTLERMP